MCNINLLYKLNGKINQNDLNVIHKMMLNSANQNPDGFGMFNDKCDIVKDKEQYAKKHKELLEKFKNSTFIVGHNRKATSGKVKTENSHPFENERFIWVHNGIVGNSVDLELKYGNVNVDTQLIGEILLEKIKKHKKFVESLKETCEEMSGSYSVFIYDKQTKKLYYFRHNAEFYISLFKIGNSHIIVGSTNKTNSKKAYVEKQFGFEINKALATMTPSDDYLYMFSKKGITKLTRLKFKPYVVTYTYPKFTYESYAIEEIEYLLNLYCDTDTIEIREQNGKMKIVTYSKLDKITIRNLLGNLVNKKLMFKPTQKIIDRILAVLSEATINERRGYYF